MAVVIAVVPDDAGLRAQPPRADEPGDQSHRS
jgi:hypothetical protein